MHAGSLSKGGLWYRELPERVRRPGPERNTTMHMNIAATSLAVGLLLFGTATGSANARDVAFCDALDATARAIVGGLRTLPSRVMMDGSRSPPVLIPGALDASAYENRGEIA